MGFYCRLSPKEIPSSNRYNLKLQTVTDYTGMVTPESEGGAKKMSIFGLPF